MPQMTIIAQYEFHVDDILTICPLVSILNSIVKVHDAESVFTAALNINGKLYLAYMGEIPDPLSISVM